ncbi:protein-L-isoaspartate O-methyltransferase family protein [Celeribacter halophilus]|jgi:protein-L-isoaspartate(D-aspartate) O-methyltransferase|uniref:Protein-L-isoaspartate O-methyltransferase n=1 Tax=Celeribacter halophilus TaxID=576117 RepID=A0AAW7XPK9_9RHOB|nr:rRNA adenine N-6-methyltransferase family protein [Celeribacter halophilus]MDO6456281.1 rRNA adenine N-6-methyltransferase family protein [Celeribacter halophilus]MDO6722772.1 rRNA adenine N-6-methyltransferase family protein [Celeribacter halophilus]
MPDFTQLRTTMVDTQVRPSDVTKFPIIEAMLTVPRENFVPEEKRAVAYVGDHVDLGNGRVVLDPRILAKMLDALNIENDELVLDLGCGLGYSSAVIARMAQAVVAVEEDEALAEEAAKALVANGSDNVILETGPIAKGEPQHGPYDVVIVQGGVEEMPEDILSQVKEKGRICAIFIDGALGIVRIGYKIDGEITWRMVFNATAPVLPGFEKRAEFAL